MSLFLLTFALPVTALGSSRPAAGWEAATLVATALLLAVCATRAVVVPTLSAVSRAVSGPAASGTPMLFWLSPDAPGRPEQPRAPGHPRPRAFPHPLT